MTQPEPILKLSDICKSFGSIKVLHSVDFELRKGEIHALAGENGAGKSTLMNIIGGVLAPTSGEIMLKGKPISIASPLEAQDNGIALVHQEIALCPDVSVAENVMMSTIGRSRSIFVNHGEIRKEAAQTLGKLTTISPDARLGSLSISNQQLVEISRALALDCEILILDEPTAALTQSEAESLFVLLRQLRDQGVAIIYISHRMSEIYKLCDRITVLRDGRHISTDRVADVTPDEVVHKLVGRRLEALYPPKSATADGPVLMQVARLSDAAMVHDVSFSLRRGEVMGLAGLIGSGRSELLQLICGLRARSSGTVTLADGTDFAPRSYSNAVAKGVVCLSEDRKMNGVFLDLSIAQNISSMRISQVSNRYGFVSQRKENDQAMVLGRRLNIKAASVLQNVSELSGGNQQKVAIARLLSIAPRIIFLDEPTRGIDVGAKAEIHQLLRQLADDGIGILVVSSELSEVLGLCDRVLVLSEGRQAGMLAGPDLTEDNLVRLAAGAAQKETSSNEAIHG
ncbi:sugar ABC transporter ATP-binding protein [Paracoccus marinaquae]|uniref:Sugar ABC transporter ATP-binding protein n=1 Tax=Paracoccus marinaquae TaxID=2841926 RepID=A0ABS6AJG6_9RHOB|nr:sugar ABC transporter ATP-binding protein [Paracoccus marinaquae]MBU3030733.1 sugar ABC transporter ATP-binding protein [Paracoccus marinaquae]